MLWYPYVYSAAHLPQSSAGGKDVGTYRWVKKKQTNKQKKKTNRKLNLSVFQGEWCNCEVSVAVQLTRDNQAILWAWWQSCSKPICYVGTSFISFSKIASLSRMSGIWLLENCRECYCRVLRYFFFCLNWLSRPCKNPCRFEQKMICSFLEADNCFFSNQILPWREIWSPCGSGSDNPKLLTWGQIRLASMFRKGFSSLFYILVHSSSGWYTECGKITWQKWLSLMILVLGHTFDKDIWQWFSYLELEREVRI